MVRHLTKDQALRQIHKNGRVTYDEGKVLDIASQRIKEQEVAMKQQMAQKVQIEERDVLYKKHVLNERKQQIFK